MGGRYRIQLGRAGAGFNAAATATAVGGATATQLRLAVADAAVVGAQQVVLSGGGDSAALTDAEIRGVRANKTGMYALEDVASSTSSACRPRPISCRPPTMRAAYAEAEAYCEERRAFLIIDIPDTTDDLDAMQTWLNDNATLRHRNAAVYFPRVTIADPLNQGRLRAFGGERHDGRPLRAHRRRRGVWKAPAGTEARLRNVQDLDYVLTDRRERRPQPAGHQLPAHLPDLRQRRLGRAHAGRRRPAGLRVEVRPGPAPGAVPRGEPLPRHASGWSSSRTTSRCGRRSGSTSAPSCTACSARARSRARRRREAYFVKCDNETTTQTDINLGIVNILVGFAPLKPAEFVIIKIQQLAGQIQT